MKQNNIIQKKYLLSFLLTITIYLSSVAQTTSYRWSNLAIGGGGFVTGIVTSPLEKGLMYCRTDVGGAYRWDTASASWIPLLDWVSENQTGYLGVESIVIDPKDPNTVYMAVGTSYFNNGNSAILKSHDRGKTFSIINVTSKFKIHGNGMGRNSGEKMAIDPKNPGIIFYGSRANGFFKSTDSATTWAKIASIDSKTTNGNGVSFVIFGYADAPSDSFTRTIIVGISRSGTSPNLYISNDGGDTFSALNGGPTDLMPQRAVLAADSNIYITYANGAGPYGTSTEPMDQGKIIKYNLVTGTFADVSPSGFNRAYSGISVDSKNTKRILASTINTYMQQGNAYGDQFFLSEDGGVTWTNIVTRGYKLDPNGVSWMTTAQSIHWAACIQFDPFDPKKAYVVSGNGIFSTDDIDATTCVWKFFVKGLDETVPYDVITLPQGPVISVIGDYDGFRNFKVDEYGPQLAPSMGSTSGLAYASLQSNIVIRAGAKVYYSLNAGETWIACKKTAGTNGYVAISADGKTFLHCPDKANACYYSKDKGNSWTKSSGVNFSSQPVADQINPYKFYLYNTSSGYIYISEDGGVTFTQAASVGGSGSLHLRTVPGHEGHIWIALYAGGLKRSVDGGQTFTKTSNVSTCSAVGIGKAKSGSDYYTIFIWGTVNSVVGVYRSTDEGTTWERVNDDAHEYGGLANGQFVLGDLNVYGRFFLSTAGRGIVYGIPTFDCNNDSAGTAYIDNCDVCVEGNTGETACITDCNGISGGTASYDVCGICSGGNTGITPNTNTSLCKIDCNGDVMGTAKIDACGVCSGGNTGVEPCPSAIPNNSEIALYTIYPNPSSSNFNLKSTGDIEYSVLNVLGKEILKGACKNIVEFGNELPNGIYILKVNNNNVTYTSKIIKNGFK